MNKTTETTPTLSLNANGTFPIRFEAGAIVLDLGRSRAANLWTYISGQTTLKLQTTRGQTVEVKPTLDNENEARLMTFPLPKQVDVTKPMQLVMNRQPVSEFLLEDGEQLVATPQHSYYQLTVAETRGLSNDLNPATLLPYDRAPRMGFVRDTHGAITDLHTHASSQVRAVEVFTSALALDRAAEHETNPEKAKALYVAYPVELLTRLAVPPKEWQTIHQVPTYPFAPMQHERLRCERDEFDETLEAQSDGSVKLNKTRATHDAVRLKDLTRIQRAAIIRAMDAEEDITKSFNNVERENYRHFNPLVKNPRLTRIMLRSMAEDYAKRGIEYAEVATSSLLTPAWFEAMVAEVDAIEKGTLNADGSRNNDAVMVGTPPDQKPFRMRFLVGLPRKYSPIKTIETLEKIKYLARHPYVVGVDLMGNETNKTSDFNWALANIAMWARSSENSDLRPEDGWNFKEDFIIRVHAGETAKNLRNVGEAVRIAHEHKVRVRVGHAQNAALDDEERAMIASMRTQEGGSDPVTGESHPRDWFGFEKCPDSNQFYRMWPLVHQVNLVDHARMANTTLGEDGNGMVHTSAQQQAFSALAAGMTLEDLARINTYERGYIKRQTERDARKTRAFEATYPKGLQSFMDGYRAIDPEAVIAERFKHKTAFFIGGANGTRFAKLDRLDQGQIEQMMEVLVRVLDPKKTFFVLGRVQNEGVSKALDIAIKRHNLAHPDSKFEVFARYASDNKNEPTSELPETISGLEMIPGGQDAVVDAAIDYAREHDAKCLLFGGGQFTSEIIQGINDPDDGPLRWAAFLPKKSEARARVLETTKPAHHIAGIEDFINRTLCETGPDALFRDKGRRDAILRKNIRIDDPEYRHQLLEEVKQEWQRGQHVLRLPQGGRSRTSTR